MPMKSKSAGCDIDKVRAELLQRNFRLVSEVGRLQAENRELKAKISQMLIVKLKAKPLTCSQAVQTDITFTPVNPTTSDISKPPVCLPKRLSRKSAHDFVVTPQKNLLTDFETPDGNHSENDTLASETVKKNPKERVRFTSQSPIAIPIDDQSKYEETPITRRVTRALSSRICTPHPSTSSNREHGSDGGKTTNSSKKCSKRDSLPCAHAEALTAYETHGRNTEIFIHRSQRASRRPISYKEHSLKDKVRKGYQFFKYTDPYET